MLIYCKKLNNQVNFLSLFQVRTFLSAIAAGGVIMEEPGFIYERMVDTWTEEKAVLPWQVTEEEALIDSPSSNTSKPA